jgi:hypothetical protein
MIPSLKTLIDAFGASNHNLDVEYFEFLFHERRQMR